MKFRVLCAIALCICLGQLCSAIRWSEMDWTARRIKTIKEQHLQNRIHNVSAQFVEDITTILDHTPKNPYFIETIEEELITALVFISQRYYDDATFSLTNMEISHVGDNELNPDYHKLLQRLDRYKILQSSLSKQFRAERYNGIINIFYISFYPYATSDEIANTLNYLQREDDAARKVSYLDLHNFPNPVVADCSPAIAEYSNLDDKLKSMIDIKPQIFKDFASIREKFPCNYDAAGLQDDVARLIIDLHGDESKLNACKQRPGYPEMTNDQFEYHSTKLESILSTRLPDETFRGLLNLMKAYQTRIPKNEIEKALEYLYDDVPTEC